MLTIAHTPDDGTTIDGTAKDDGSGEIVKRHGFRWGRTQSVWFLRNTRGRAAQQHTINLCAKELREAGFEVTVEIENGTAEEREAAYVNAREQRAEYLGERSERLAAKAEAESDKAHGAVAGIPFGQPILVGHHSERRHRAALKRSDAAMGRAVQAHRDSEATANVARSAAADVAQREDPAFIGRRIADREREIRDYERKLNGTSRNGMAYGQKAEGAYRERITALLEEAREELAMWQRKLAATGAKVYTRADLEVGGFVKIRHGWSKIAKLNPKTVACEVGMPWPLKYEYTEIKGYRPPEEEAA
jgi:hypothetical protein